VSRFIDGLEGAAILSKERRFAIAVFQNIELAAPDDFIPPLPGWEEWSIFIARRGKIDFYHYDLYAQALAKIERGHARDLADGAGDACTRPARAGAAAGIICRDRASADPLSSGRPIAA
jgi:hypothetical protein